MTVKKAAFCAAAFVVIFNPFFGRVIVAYFAHSGKVA